MKIWILDSDCPLQFPSLHMHECINFIPQFQKCFGSSRPMNLNNKQGGKKKKLMTIIITKRVYGKVDVHVWMLQIFGCFPFHAE